MRTWLQLAAVHGVPRRLGRHARAAVDPRGARLVCLGGEGVTTVEIAFDPPVRDGGELWRRMASAPATARPPR